MLIENNQTENLTILYDVVYMTFSKSVVTGAQWLGARGWYNYNCIVRGNFIG